ncbi:MAG: hypothetical protein AB1486_02015 [Planctomycetota bacterium]
MLPVTRLASIAMLGVFLFFAETAMGKIWYVGGSGSDFVEIRDAVAVAQDGDIIMVRPGSYQPFELLRGVMIKASSTQFTVTGPVSVLSISAGARGGIAGMRITYALAASDCAGELVLEDIFVDPPYTCDLETLPEHYLEIVRCDNVSLHNFSHSTPECWGYPLDTGITPVRIASSTIRMSDVTAVGGNGAHMFPKPDPGADGISAEDSVLVLAHHVSITGGDGCREFWEGTGGDGGDGISALASSHVIILGDEVDRIRGGDGGRGGDYMGMGGDGGHGIRVSDEGDAVVSRVTLEGGEGGAGMGGSPDGAPGLPAVGNVRFDHRFPFLELTSLSPGVALQVTVESRPEHGVVVLLVAECSGFIENPQILGPPLSVTPGGYFFTLPIGHTDADNRVTVGTSFPSDPSLQGFVVNLQAVVLADSGLRLLTNAISRVVSE